MAFQATVTPQGRRHKRTAVGSCRDSISTSLSTGEWPASQAHTTRAPAWTEWFTTPYRLTNRLTLNRSPWGGPCVGVPDSGTAETKNQQRATGWALHAYLVGFDCPFPLFIIVIMSKLFYQFQYHFVRNSSDIFLIFFQVIILTLLLDFSIW